MKFIKIFTNWFFKKRKVRKELEKVVGKIAFVWILECIYYKNEYCIDIPEHKGKTYEEITALYGLTSYWTWQEFFEFMTDGKPLEPSNGKRKKKESKGTFPYFLGGTIKDEKIIFFSYNQQGNTQDVFYIEYEENFLLSFSKELLLSYLTIVSELKSLGFKPEKTDNISFCFFSKLRHT